jgi:hypothetical protein
MTSIIERIGASGFLDFEERNLSNQRDEWGDRNHYAPHEVLLGSAGVPKGDEDDLEIMYGQYLANLPPKLELPESDILKAIHAYTSDLFSVIPSKEKGYMSMDHTALLAAGILLEEMAVEALGETGYLALLESARMQSGRVPTFWNGRREVPFYYEGNQRKGKSQNDEDSDEDMEDYESPEDEMGDSDSIARSEPTRDSVTGDSESVNLSTEEEAAVQSD